MSKRVHYLTTPLDERMVAPLRAGDEVLLSGTILTARDAAHQRLIAFLERGKRIPLALAGAVIYYAGPTPPRPGRPIGSCGPTTSSRMDTFTPPLLALGLRGMIGKGDRSAAVRAAIRKHRAIYFLATGGIGALLSTKVIAARPILFKELGPEAVYQLKVQHFPLIVGIDAKGRNIYETVRRKKAA